MPGNAKVGTVVTRSDKTYMCDFDFSKLNMPVGKKILVSFGVDGILMKADAIGHILVNYSVAPEGKV